MFTYIYDCVRWVCGCVWGCWRALGKYAVRMCVA